MKSTTLKINVIPDSSAINFSFACFKFAIMGIKTAETVRIAAGQPTMINRKIKININTYTIGFREYFFKESKNFPIPTNKANKKNFYDPLISI